jgi:uroporphyrinogen decarboxylase
MDISRTLVYKTLEFESPQRVPRQLWVLPWAEDHYPDELLQIQKDYPDDIINVPSFFRQSPETIGGAYEIGTFVDEWGCTFLNIQRGVIGEVKKPLVNQWGDLDKLHLPLACLSVDIEQVNAFCRNTDKFVIAGCCPRPFERLQFIRKSEQLYLDLAEQRAEFFDLLNRVHQYYLQEMELWASSDVDGLSFMDDWGSQHSLLISPRQWRLIFKPLYKDYIDIAHAHRKKAFMHSDGFTAAIIPDLIELGLDALNTQIFTMDIEELGRQFGGKITFWGELDRQDLLPNGTLDNIINAVHRVYHAFWRKGGVIAQCEFGAGSRPENVRQMFETWYQLFIKNDRVFVNNQT